MRFLARISPLPLLLLTGLLSAAAPALAEAPRPTVLLVTAHPDDDALFSGAVYKITHALGGKVDLAVLTNGEGGYRFSTLAEPIYGLELTREEIGRAYLPAIRKRELMAGGAIVGIRNYFFLDQVDGGFTRDLKEILGGGWDLGAIRQRLGGILAQGSYDFVFTMLPTPETHAHHQAAALFALEAVAALPEGKRPAVLAGWFRRANLRGENGAAPYTGLADHPLTRIEEGSPVYVFDRTRKFGTDDRLDYQIIANWVIAEHKSQGTMQQLMNRATEEVYHLYSLNDPAAATAAQALFEALAQGPPHASLLPRP